MNKSTIEKCIQHLGADKNNFDGTVIQTSWVAVETDSCNDWYITLCRLLLCESEYTVEPMPLSARG